MERKPHGVARLRPRILASAVLAVAVAAAWTAVEQGLRHRSIGPPARLPVVAAGGLPAGLEVRAAHAGKLLAALAAAGRSGASVVDVRAGDRRGSGFVAWTDARHSYVLTAAPVVSALLDSGGRNLEVRARGVGYPGRLIDADVGSRLALVRVRSRLAPGILDLRPGTLEPGRVAVTVSLQAGGRPRVQAVDLRMTEDAVLLATGARALTVGSPILLLNGHLGGIVVRGGRQAIVLPLAHCRTRERCFGPTLP